MKTIKQFLFLWAPVFFWMGLIFYLSSRTRISVDELYIVNLIIFKTLHVIEYGILFFLLARALSQNKMSKRHYLLFAFVLSVLYAVSDEIHQSFVPSREGKLRDVFIDSIGIAIMYMYTKKRPSILRNL